MAGIRRVVSDSDVQFGCKPGIHRSALNQCRGHRCCQEQLQGRQHIDETSEENPAHDIKIAPAGTMCQWAMRVNTSPEQIWATGRLS